MNERNVSKLLETTVAELDRLDREAMPLPGEIYSMKKVLEFIARYPDEAEATEASMEDVGRRTVTLLMTALFVASVARSERDKARGLIDGIFERIGSEVYES